MPSQHADDVAAKKRLFDRYADAVLRRKVAEIELRKATAEFEFASNAYLTMMAEERRAALNNGDGAGLRPNPGGTRYGE